MPCILVEEDPILRVVPAILDPNTPTEHQRAIAQFYDFDEPDFIGWRDRLRARLPGLYPSTVIFAADQEKCRSRWDYCDFLSPNLQTFQWPQLP